MSATVISVFASRSCAKESLRRMMYACGVIPNDLRNFRKKCDGEIPQLDASSAMRILASNLASMNSSMRRQRRGDKPLDCLVAILRSHHGWQTILGVATYSLNPLSGNKWSRSGGCMRTTPVSKFAANTEQDLTPGAVVSERCVRELEVGAQMLIEQIERIGGDLHLVRPAEQLRQIQAR
jgi:hypothetical protein